MFLITIITLCLHLITGTEASSFATYSDSTCSAADVVQNLAATNAYPAGSCTSLESATTDSYSGFQFLTLDAGCAITIYQADETAQPCSGYAVLGSVNTCYNTSWAYYSVDNCDIPALLSIALTASQTSTRTATSETANSLSGSQTAATSSSPSTSVAASGGVDLGGGDVAGIVIGCIAGTAIILSGIWFLMRRRRVVEQNPAATTQKFQESAPPTEYSSSYVQTPYTSEVHGQGFVEAPYGSHYPTIYTGNAELNGQTEPRELPNQRY